MELRLKSDPAFLSKKGLTDVVVNKIGPGQYTVTSRDFKQIIKEPEYQALLAVSNVVGQSLSNKCKEDKDEGGGDEDNLTPREKRVVELNDLTKADLLPMAEEKYDDVNKKSNKPDLIELIVKAEFKE